MDKLKLSLKLNLCCLFQPIITIIIIIIIIIIIKITIIITITIIINGVPAEQEKQQIQPTCEI